MQQRIEWIDIAKGIGILLVIAGHTIWLGYCFPIYAFHMPLFFFLSGIVYRDKNDTFLSFFKNKTKALIRPWFIFIFISFLFCLLIPQWRQNLALKSILDDFYTSNTNTLQNSSLWYLVCFYFVMIFFFFINKIKRTYVVRFLYLVVAIALLWEKTVLDMTNLPFCRLPFKIDSALIALVFFSLAVWGKDIMIAIVSAKFSNKRILLLVVLTIGFSAFNLWSNINALAFGRIKLLYYPIAFLGIASTCVVSQKISQTNLVLLRRLLLFYGKNSLLIFGFQSLFIRLYLLIFNNIQGLNMELYGNNPIIHQVGAFIIVSFVISPLIVYLINYLRSKKLSLL